MPLDQTHRTHPGNTRLPRRKTWLILGLAVISLVLIALLAGVYLVRSGKVNQYITSQVKQALGEYGVRAEIGGFDLSWGARTAVVRDVKLFNQSSDKLIAALDRAVLVVEIPSPFALSLHRDVIFKRLDLTNLRLALDVDQQGLTNFSGLHSAPPSAPSRITFDFSRLLGSIDGGTIQVNDRAHGVKAELANIQVNGQPMAGTSLVKVKLTSAGGPVTYDRQETKLDSVAFSGQVGETGLNIEEFALGSPVLQMTASGKIDNEGGLTYNIGLQG